MGDFIFLRTRLIFQPCQLLLKVATKICGVVSYLSESELVFIFHCNYLFIFFFNWNFWTSPCLCNLNVTWTGCELKPLFAWRSIGYTKQCQRFGSVSRALNLSELESSLLWQFKTTTLLLGEVKSAPVYFCKSRASPSPALLGSDLVFGSQCSWLKVPLFHSWLQWHPRSRCEDVWMWSLRKVQAPQTARWFLLKYKSSVNNSTYECAWINKCTISRETAVNTGRPVRPWYTFPQCFCGYLLFTCASANCG